MTPHQRTAIEHPLLAAALLPPGKRENPALVAQEIMRRMEASNRWFSRTIVKGQVVSRVLTIDGSKHPRWHASAALPGRPLNSTTGQLLIAEVQKLLQGVGETSEARRIEAATHADMLLASEAVHGTDGSVLFVTPSSVHLYRPMTPDERAELDRNVARLESRLT